jgi:hypothetical protein
MAWVLQQAGAKLCTGVMSTAASKGHVAMCKYLHSRQCPWSVHSTERAAFGGHVDLLRWLIDTGCPFEACELCKEAAAKGHVEVLTYLQQQGLLTSVLASAPTLTALLNRSGSYNQLATAKWFRDHGAEWPTNFQYGQWREEVLHWARAEGCVTPTRY